MTVSPSRQGIVLTESTDAVSLVAVDQIVAALRRVVGNGRVALHEPCFKGNEWRYVKECLDTAYVSSVGDYVNRFEADLAAYTGAKHVIAVVNGTAALHVALMLAGVRPDDEVLVPTLTFVATANAVVYCGATPHFVDSEAHMLGIDTIRLRDHLSSIATRRGGQCINKHTGRVIRAMVPMHTFGHPGDIEGLLALARDFNLSLVEDAAEALGSYYHGRHVGTMGLLGILSFNGNKTITTGGGGAILTNDDDLARRARHITTTAKIAHPWAYEHDMVGFNYRLPNLNAALGCAQLEQLPEFLLAKRRLFLRYREALEGIPLVRLQIEPEGARSNYWLQTLLLDHTLTEVRDTLLRVTNENGIMTRPPWNLLHRLGPFQSCPAAPLAEAEGLAVRMLNLPSSAFLA